MLILVYKVGLGQKHSVRICWSPTMPVSSARAVCPTQCSLADVHSTLFPVSCSAYNSYADGKRQGRPEKVLAIRLGLPLASSQGTFFSQWDRMLPSWFHQKFQPTNTVSGGGGRLSKFTPACFLPCLLQASYFLLHGQVGSPA